MAMSRRSPKPHCGPASAEWTDSAAPGRVRPHLDYLYLFAAAAYMRVDQTNLWMYP